MVLNSEDDVVPFEFLATLLQYLCSQIVNMIICSLVDIGVKELRDFLYLPEAAYIMSLSVILILKVLQVLVFIDLAYHGV